jgi:hypothetical protein
MIGLLVVAEVALKVVVCVYIYGKWKSTRDMVTSRSAQSVRYYENQLDAPAISFNSIQECVISPISFTMSEAA